MSLQPHSPPFLIYHRGRHGTLPDGRTLPENSLEAFEQAVIEGAQMVEMDVWDGLRIEHDPNNSLNAPSLPAVLEALAGRCSVNIEIKSPRALDKALECVSAAVKSGTWNNEQFVISAFHHPTAMRCKKAAPHLRTGIINDGVPLPEYIERIAACGIENLHLDWANIYMDIEANYALKEVVERTAMRIWTWTVNTRATFDIVAGYGVEAVFTDLPEILRSGNEAR